MQSNKEAPGKNDAHIQEGYTKLGNAKDCVWYLVVVRFVREQLRTHVVRRSDQGARHVVLILQNPCDAQITYFDYVRLCQEDVLRFQISVQDVFLVQILKRKKVSESASY